MRFATLGLQPSDVGGGGAVHESRHPGEQSMQAGQIALTPFPYPNFAQDSVIGPSGAIVR